MAKKTASDATPKANARRKAAAVADKVRGLKLLGEIITWNARSESTHTHSDVVKALTDADLDSDVATELLPRFAFARAARKLTEDRIIDAVNESDENIIFQFTKKFISQEEWQYSRETFLRLNKLSGKITCDIPELEAMAQAELDKAMIVRTTNDITKIVQKLFEKNADLFPVREQGGVYFVPESHTPFIAKIDNFLTALGGSVTRFPVPAGTQHGDKAVQTSVAEALSALIEEHNNAVDQFSLNTRSDTIENAADKIKATRVKIEAYASYLRDRSDDLLKEVDAANAKLIAQVDALSKQREAAPPKAEGSNRMFEYPVTAVIRWMGSVGWRFERARQVLDHYQMSVADGTIRTQLVSGRKGRGEPATLTDAQAKELEKAGKPTKKEKKAAK